MMKRSAGSVWATWVPNEERQRDPSRRQAAEAMGAAQNSVPAGEPLLVRLEQPYLMDFSRNPIRVVDHPGAVSPPPGLPVFEGGDAIRDYLVGQGIRYLAFSYRTDANFSRERFGARLDPGFHPVPRHLAEIAFAFDEALHELATTRRKLYDDGDTFVLDLKEPGPDASAP